MRKAKFYYRYMTMHGIPYQKYPEFRTFIRRYRGMDWFEREKWITAKPEVDAARRYEKMVDRIIRTGQAAQKPLTVRRYFLSRWFNTMQNEFWKHFIPEYKIGLLNELMRMCRKYVTSGKKSTELTKYGIDTVYAGLQRAAKRTAYTKLLEKQRTSIPISPRQGA